MPLVALQNTYASAGNISAAASLLQANPILYECIINADKLQQLHHAILAVQEQFFDDVEQQIFKIGRLKGDWNENMSSDGDGEYLLNKYDVVRYPVDDVSQYFLVYGNEIQAGEIPTESENYLQISMKGDKGDTGYCPIKGIDYFDGITPVKGEDYFDGNNGLGLAPCGAWVNNRHYDIYSMVSHNGALWYSTEECEGEEPHDTSAIWIKINITMQTYVGTERPTGLQTDGLWVHIQEDGHVILKKVNEIGEESELYPETKASFVIDASGQQLQRKLYREYFGRDDITINIYVSEDELEYTQEAILSETEIVIARQITTDNLDTDDGNIITEFIAYDESGENIVYHRFSTMTETVDSETGRIVYNTYHDVQS